MLVFIKLENQLNFIKKAADYTSFGFNRAYNNTILIAAAFLIYFLRKLFNILIYSRDPIIQLCSHYMSISLEIQRRNDSYSLKQVQKIQFLIFKKHFQTPIS